MPDSPRSIDDFPAAAVADRPTVVRIFVGPDDGSGPAERLVVHEPRAAGLTFREVGLHEALAPGTDDAGALTTLVWLPSGARSPHELQKRAEDWMASRDGERGAAYEVGWRSDRILWRRGRALCIGNPESRRDVRDAIAYFTFCESELASLEARLAALWPTLEGDLALTHRVGVAEVKRQPDVDRRTVQAHAMRMEFIRLSTALERLDRVLSAPAQRIVAELALQADTVERLRLLDDGIEFAQETYDTVNDRLLEYRYFRTEYRIELVIALILLAELIAVCFEIWQNG